MSPVERERLRRLAELLRAESRRLEGLDVDGAFRCIEAAGGIEERLHDGALRVFTAYPELVAG
jgi:hypothetical protein